MHFKTFGEHSLKEQYAIFNVRVKSTACKPKQRGFALGSISSIVSEATNTCWASGENVKRRCKVDDAASVWMSSEWAANIRAEGWPSVPRTLSPCCVSESNYRTAIVLEDFGSMGILLKIYLTGYIWRRAYNDDAASGPTCQVFVSLQVCHIWVLQHLKVIHWLCAITHLTVILAGVILPPIACCLGSWEQRDHRVAGKLRAQAVNYLLCDNSH